MQQLRLGIDIACRAAHQASLVDEQGRFLWSGRRFRTRSEDLEALWASLPADAEVTVVMEPTRNAWVALASWFGRKGATVVMVPSEQSADLRDYYAKHTKSDRLDSKIWARIPLLHPEGLYAHEHLGPAVPIRRATRLRSSLVKRRSEVLGRIDAHLEIMGPQWHQALGLTKRSSLRFCAAGYTDPHLCKRLGRARLGRFFHRHSHGRFGDPDAVRVLAAADENLALWNDELDYGELADDIRWRNFRADQRDAQVQGGHRRRAPRSTGLVFGSSVPWTAPNATPGPTTRTSRVAILIGYRIASVTWMRQRCRQSRLVAQPRPQRSGGAASSPRQGITLWRESGLPQR